MARDIAKLIEEMRANPADVRFSDALWLAEQFFGAPRQGQGSHTAIFKMPWPSDPRVNMQEAKALEQNKIANLLHP